MIRHLYIKDFILIDELNIDLKAGFTAITGETGAGKSILIGAIGLILGNRADTKTIREGADKAIIEATFDISQINGMKELFDSHDLDYDTNCIVRRELTTMGKSRAFINDTPVTATQLREIGERLIDIHSQHHNMLLGDLHYQMAVIDTLADHKELIDRYRYTYQNFIKCKEELESERERLSSMQKDMDYISFQLEQLNDAGLKDNEEKEIEQRLDMAHHSQEITKILQGIRALTENETDSEVPGDIISSLVKGLNRVQDHFSAGATLYERLEALKIELFDLSAEADDILSDIEIDEQEVEALEQRIDLLQGLMYKHNVSSCTELIKIRDEYASHIDQVDGTDERLKELEQAMNKAHDQASALADQLSKQRQEAADSILPDLNELMTQLGIAGATFTAEITPLKELSPLGRDRISFLFATNNKSTLRPIREIASGGEISRFMLALKTILSSRTTLPTVIFDEIDTGVSGEIAEKLGSVMYQLSTHIQVLSITHLPQIAALADHHLIVEKRKSDDEFVSTINEVEGEERIQRLATMLAGIRLTPEAIENARSLLLQHHDNSKQSKK